ncbi:MAG: hypothetical protein K0V04_29540 [Deltaproteobacteria bacterium]|nr:hypothetical protein [Deltaproteobacteria bacterium]
MFSRSEQQKQPFVGAAVAGPMLVALAIAGTATPAVGANSLATPITAELRQELWPVKVAVEIVAVDDDDGNAGPAEPMPRREVVVPDGNHLAFSTAVWTSRGRRDFAVDVVAHHHPRGDMEIEWDLRVEDAPYQTVSVGEYVLHRLRFGPRPGVGPEQVRISRADIVTTHGEPHVEAVEIDGAKYEVRIFALSARG